MSDSAQGARMVPSGDSQPSAAKPARVYPKRSMRALTDWQKREALRGLHAGRSSHVVAMELGVSYSVVLDLWVSDLDKQVRELRRAA
jgi:hypothetical protein